MVKFGKRMNPLRLVAGLFAALALFAVTALLAPTAAPLEAAEISVPAATPKPAAASTPAPHAELSLLPVARWLRSGEYAWIDGDKGSGPVSIVVDLRARTLSVYRQGVEIGRSSVVYGYDDKPTPLGAFTILQKKARHISNLYNAPMPWMMRLTWDGVAIHGSQMADDKATHGCIGVPDEFGKALFALAGMGTRVVINDGPPGRADYTAYAALPYRAAL
jgi:hypothetical protein